LPLLDLDRFVRAQDGVFDTALAELRAGRKRSHWMWYVFPQLDGLGSSPTARAYAISGPGEASAYLAHPVLGPRLSECCSALLDLPAPRDISDIMGYPDDLKLRSSMTLFAACAADPALFEQVLTRYYDGPDERTLALLGPARSPGRE
jgi:uncharacterized protein (DUF1810 family)